MSAERILVIEDDSEIREMLKYAFASEGWELLMAGTGEEGLKLLSGQGADCVILDIMLPGMDGFKTLKKIHEDEGSQGVPVIMCTARGEDADIVAGLELGAEDYVVKPYSPRVLAARIRAALRRREDAAARPAKSIWRRGELSLDEERHAAFLGELPLDLSATEFALLAQFLKYPETVFSRNRLITAVHGPGYPATDRSVDVQILGLRKKLGKAGDLIETIRGVGYRFKAP